MDLASSAPGALGPAAVAGGVPLSVTCVGVALLVALALLLAFLGVSAARYRARQYLQFALVPVVEEDGGHLVDKAPGRSRRRWAFAAADGSVTALHRMGNDFAVFNPSATPDGRVVVMRASNFNFCPHASNAVVVTGVVSEVVVRAAGRTLQVSCPPWAEPVWTRGPGRIAGPEDPRPFYLAPGRVGVMCTVVHAGKHAVMSVIVLEPFPLGDREEVTSTVARGVGPGLGRPAASATADRVVDAALVDPAAIVELGPTEAAPNKNWPPVVHGGRVWWIKHIAPQTTVSVAVEDLLAARGLAQLDVRVDLAADPASLAVTRQDERKWRSSCPLVPYGGHLLGAAHRFTRSNARAPAAVNGATGFLFGPSYDHALALYDPEPPFRLVAFSRPFHLRVRREPGSFVYVSGATRIADKDGRPVLALLCGVDDCAVARHDLALEEVAALFAAGPDAPLVTFWL